MQFTRHPEEPSSWIDGKGPVAIVVGQTMAAFPQDARPAEFFRLRRLP